MSWLKERLWFLTVVERSPCVYKLSVTGDMFINSTHVGTADALEARGYKVHRDPYTPLWSETRRWLWERK